MIVTGRDVSTDAAMILPQIAESAYLKLEMATTAVCCAGLVVMIMAYKYSFQDIVNAKVATTAIPGSAIGVMIYLKDFIQVQPSIRAASSSA